MSRKRTPTLAETIAAASIEDLRALALELGAENARLRHVLAAVIESDGTQCARVETTMPKGGGFNVTVTGAPNEETIGREVMAVFKRLFAAMHIDLDLKTEEQRGVQRFDTETDR